MTASPDAAANANTVTVDADGTAQVKVSATPPDGVDEGSYPINVTIASDTAAPGTLQLTAEVTGSSKLDVATADQRLNFSGKANDEKRVTLVVGNTGTAAVDAVQFAATPPSGWTVTFDPPTVDEVKPNETTQVVAVIKPAKNALAGDYAIGLRASAGSQSSNLDLRYGVKGSQTLGHRRDRDHRLRVPRAGLALPPARSTVIPMTRGCTADVDDVRHRAACDRPGDQRPDQALRRTDRGRLAEPADPPRRDLRVARSERCRQDHHDPDAARSHRTNERHSPGRRSRSPTRPARRETPRRLPARRRRLLRRRDGPREPPVHRPAQPLRRARPRPNGSSSCSSRSG